MIDKNCPLIFMHIPKTGGMSMFTGMCRQYGTHIADMYDMTADDVRAAPAEGVLRDPDICVYSGHFPFGLHEWLSRPSCYMAIVRKPLERILSLYFYTIPFREYILKVRKETGKSLQELFGTGEVPDFYAEFIPWLEGEQTLARFLDCNAAELDNAMVRRFSGTGLQTGPCPAQALDTAKENIENYFSLVGVLERYPETVQLAQQTFGWSWLAEHRVNARTEKSPKQRNITNNMKRRIKEMNRLDMDLYDWILRRFEKQRVTPTPPIMVPGGGRTDFDQVKLWKSIGSSPIRKAAMREGG